MKKYITLGLSAAALVAAPFAASAQQYTEAQLLQIAIQNNVCSTGTATRAFYSDVATNRVTVQCLVGDAAAGGTLTGGLAGAPLAIGGLVLAAVLIGGNNSTGTTGTTGTGLGG